VNKGIKIKAIPWVKNLFRENKDAEKCW